MLTPMLVDKSVESATKLAPMLVDKSVESATKWCSQRIVSDMDVYVFD